jgi:hypothetical protein
MLPAFYLLRECWDDYFIASCSNSWHHPASPTYGFRKIMSSEQWDTLCFCLIAFLPPVQMRDQSKIIILQLGS